MTENKQPPRTNTRNYKQVRHILVGILSENRRPKENQKT